MKGPALFLNSKFHRDLEQVRLPGYEKPMFPTIQLIARSNQRLILMICLSGNAINPGQLVDLTLSSDEESDV